MKLRNKRHWIALFAAIFLSSKVAAAVQVCVHDMARIGSVVESEIYASANSKADHAPAPGAEECCAAEVQARAVAPADCCAEAVPVRRSGGPPCCAGSPPLETAPAASSLLPYGTWKPAVPVAAPPAHVAGLPFSIVFKNFRS